MSRRANWKWFTDAIGNTIYDRINAMSDKHLRALLRSLREVPPNGGNCWWLSYHIAPLVKDIANDTLRVRRNQRKRIAKATTPIDKLSAMVIPDPDAPRVEYHLH